LSTWRPRFLVLAIGFACQERGADPDVTPREQGDAGECEDDVDNDSDGVADCDDADCADADACVDTDGDGLMDREELNLGTDPQLADTDRDGLDDGEEVELGTDPTRADSDGDGSPDGLEVAEGTDPLVVEFSYQGGWPYNSEDVKQAIEESSPSEAEAVVGGRFERFTLEDQFGDMVDLYDFAWQGVPIVLQLSAEWGEPDRALSEWLRERPTNGYFALSPQLARAVQEGRIRWITVLCEARSGGQPSGAAARIWFDEFPNPVVPVLADAAGGLRAFADIQRWPLLIALDEDMTVTAYDDWDFIDRLAR
jgi:hypothetical protein